MSITYIRKEISDNEADNDHVKSNAERRHEIEILEIKAKNIKNDISYLGNQLKAMADARNKKKTVVLPRSILLFDEIEKMHPAITRALLPMFDDGILPLANGTRIDFRQCAIFMTSNIGSDYLAKMQEGKGEPIGFATKTSEEAGDTTISELEIYKVLMSKIKSSSHFPPELIGRIGKENFIVFHELKDSDKMRIINEQLNKLRDRFQKVVKGLKLEFHESLKQYVLREVSDKMSKSLGARPIGNVISAKISPALTNLVIKGEHGGIVENDEVLIEAVQFTNPKGKKKYKVEVKKLVPELATESSDGGKQPFPVA
jgi:ATP-dependent Clp protease ATP-binding subunit ClpA